MKRKRNTEERNIRLLKGHAAGTTIEELSRKHGIAKSSLQRWKAKFSGMEASEDQGGREIAAGEVGGDPAKLERGYYQAVVDSNPKQTFDDVEIVCEDSITLELP